MRGGRPEVEDCDQYCPVCRGHEAHKPGCRLAKPQK